MGSLKSVYSLLLASAVLGCVLRFYLSLFFPNYLPGILHRHHKECTVRFVYNRAPAENSKTACGNTSLLFVGVMTASKYLNTRAWAVNQTWASDISGHVEFFTSQFNETETPGGKSKQIPVHMLKGVKDNEYPPQKKVFAMLRYMYENYLDKYEWFMRADDDVYIRTDKLMEFLRTLDSSEDMVVGQGGTGKPDELNKLGLIKNEYYCLGGPGVIMSRSVLKKIAPNLDSCLQETVSDHEDVELGRCIRKYAGLSCLRAREENCILEWLPKTLQTTRTICTSNENGNNMTDAKDNVPTLWLEMPYIVQKKNNNYVTQKLFIPVNVNMISRAMDKSS